MPKDRIENAVNKASSKDTASMDEVNYEGYAPHGIAIFIETATDNPTRTVANVRSIINKYGGAMGTAGSLDYLFERKGVFTIGRPEGDLEEFELELIDHGLEDIFETEDGFVVQSSFADFGNLQKALEAKGIELRSAGSQRIPANLVELPPEQEAEVMKLIEMLEEDEDVQHVYSTLKHSGDA